MLVENDVAKESGADWIQAAERLIENQQVGAVNDRGNQLNFLEHSFRKLLTLFLFRVFKAHTGEEVLNAFLNSSFRYPLQTRHVGEERSDSHLPVDSTLLRKVADPIFGLQRR